MKDPNSNQTVLATTTEMAVHKPIQRWSAARKRDVVLRLLRGESIEAVSRQVAVEPYRLEQWRERALGWIARRTQGSWRLARLGYMSPLDYRTRHTAAQTLAMATSAILLFDRNATDPAVPTCRMPSQRAQGRSSKAEGLRVSGLCLTEPRTLAISVWLGKA